jgi:hypothetical integral membrane protein (TIGR02206 family)
MWADERYDFTTLGPVHWVALVVFVLGCVWLVRLGRRQRGTGREVGFSRAFALAIPLFTVPMQVLQFTPEEWNLDTSLPLQICDLAWMLAVYALWTRRRWAAAVSWLWGMTLTMQGILTPDLASGWAEPRFWMFWGMHWLVVWAGVYLVWGLRIVPTWRDYRIAVGITAAWAAGVMVFNAFVGTNYGYLNRKPANASLLDLLGPWPGYVVVEVVVVAAVWALMTWLWVRREPE